MTTASNKPTKRKTSTTPTTPGKAAKAAKAAPKSAAKTNSKNRKPAIQEITPEQRHQLIAEAAYLRAEARGFSTEDPVHDWLAAEQEVDARLTGQAQGTGKVIH